MKTAAKAGYFSLASLINKKEVTLMYELRVKSHFDAAHYIKDYDGKCSREHGHRWKVEVAIRGKELDKLNMLVDFGVVKEPLNYIIDTFLDHYQLNERLSEKNITAEYLAKWVYDGFSKLPPIGIRIAEVTIWESPECCVKYYES